MSIQYDVLIVGGGNAGMSAALAASEQGARVGLIDRAPEEWAGGNTYFTAGAFRVAHKGAADLGTWVSTRGRELADIEIPPYSTDDYFEDMLRLTAGRTDRTLARILVEESSDGARWLASQGVNWELLYERQSFIIDGRATFWGNLPVGTRGGGKGMVADELAAVRKAGVDVRFSTGLKGIVTDRGRAVGVIATSPGEDDMEIRAGSVVIASGGFQSDSRRRAMYLGPGWELAKVRGTPHNTGDGIFAALEVGAQPHGNWSGCHAIAWDLAAPAHGSREITNQYSRQAYPYGLVVNEQGERFVDEGADFRNYTYAKYGPMIMQQPNQRAFQLFDSRSLPLLSEIDYNTAIESRWTASTIEELAGLIGVPVTALRATIEDYNASLNGGEFDPTRKDDLHTVGITPPKSNWAQAYDSPPYVAFGVTCGITFTFGGLRIDESGRVLDLSQGAIPGLFACGEAVGGLFYSNYPGGSGLAAGTVFGRRAGAGAAEYAKSRSIVASP